MSREIIQDALNGIRDEFITEAGARLGLVAVGAAAVGVTGAASGAVTHPSTLYPLSGSGTAVKTGFGAWLTKGGWIALAAGVLVAVGVAVGAFLLGRGEDIPTVGSGDVTAEQDTSEGASGETADGTEGDTPGGISDGTAEETESETPTETEAETLAPSDFLDYISNGDGTCYVSGDHGGWQNTDIVIPPVSPDGDIVTAIGREAFEGWTITSVVIPDTITHIGSFAFRSCWDLTSINIPDSVVSIGTDAFADSKKVVRRKKGLYYVGDWVVDCDPDLTEVVWREGTKGIAGCAFEDCEKLTSIVIPDGVIFIGDYAFDGCTSMTSIEIPDSVVYLGGHAFSGCRSLTSIVIPNSVTAIESFTFATCTSLMSIVIPDSVVSIGGYVFMGCTELTDIYYTGYRSQWARISKGTFWEPDSDAYTIHDRYVP